LGFQLQSIIWATSQGWSRRSFIPSPRWTPYVYGPDVISSIKILSSGLVEDMAKEMTPSLYITGKPQMFGHFDVAPEVGYLSIYLHLSIYLSIYIYIDR